jgi:hypothetical protein
MHLSHAIHAYDHRCSCALSSNTFALSFTAKPSILVDWINLNSKYYGINAGGAIRIYQQSDFYISIGRE